MRPTKCRPLPMLWRLPKCSRRPASMKAAWRTQTIATDISAIAASTAGAAPLEFDLVQHHRHCDQSERARAGFTAHRRYGSALFPPTGRPETKEPGDIVRYQHAGGLHIHRGLLAPDASASNFQVVKPNSNGASSVNIRSTPRPTSTRCRAPSRSTGSRPMVSI